MRTVTLELYKHDLTMLKKYLPIVKLTVTNQPMTNDERQVWSLMHRVDVAWREGVKDDA